MKKIFGFVVLFSYIVNAEPIKQAELWSECVQSYKESKAVFFDVAFNEKDPKKHLMFRNGKYFSPESLNIYHDGKLWTTEIKIEDGFYAKKDALVTIGNEKFCLKQEFNWVRTDNMSLVPYSEKTCIATITYNMSLSQGDQKPNAEEVLFVKLRNDVNLALNCMTNKREVGCQDMEKAVEYKRLLKWNTQACEKIDHVKLKELIAEKKRVYAEYRSEMKLDANPSKETSPAGKKVRKLN